MKKILIFMSLTDLKPTGGPAGYLYNLKQALDLKECAVDFLPEYNKKNIKNNIKKYIPKRIIDFCRAIKYTQLLDKQKNISIDYSKYDIIHFHSTIDMYFARNILKNYSGKVVLTSHSPCAYHKELIDKLNKYDYQLLKNKIDKLEKIDKYAFERADYVIFPCKEAEEPYFNSWQEYSKIRKEEKIRYLYTGINACSYKIEKKEIRHRYGLNDSDFVISYVGRHNKIKGYDNLIQIGKQAIENLNVKVLVAGKQGKIQAPKNKNWIEVGWTNDPHSIINSADIFILPNKETYFDLIMLEVLSLGKIILTTYTGGNKIFKNFDDIGVFYYNNNEECLEQIEYIKSLSKNKIKQYEQKNKEIFYKMFSKEIFSDKYIELMEELY